MENLILAVFLVGLIAPKPLEVENLFFLNCLPFTLQIWYNDDDNLLIIRDSSPSKITYQSKVSPCTHLVGR